MHEIIVILFGYWLRRYKIFWKKTTNLLRLYMYLCFNLYHHTLFLKILYVQCKHFFLLCRQALMRLNVYSKRHVAKTQNEYVLFYFIFFISGWNGVLQLYSQICTAVHKYLIPPRWPTKQQVFLQVSQLRNVKSILLRGPCTSYTYTYTRCRKIWPISLVLSCNLPFYYLNNTDFDTDNFKIIILTKHKIALDFLEYIITSEWKRSFNNNKVKRLNWL